jgi:hypothetical protein
MPIRVASGSTEVTAPPRPTATGFLSGAGRAAARRPVASASAPAATEASGMLAAARQSAPTPAAATRGNESRRRCGAVVRVAGRVCSAGLMFHAYHAL